ncbi:MAG: hypothetical protein ACOC1F_09605 [Myxococcota bacterium]
MVLGMAAAIEGCGGTALDPSRAEHEARQLAPIPACATVLPTSGPSGMQVSLRDEYWKLVFPAFDEERKSLPPGARACTGMEVLSDPAFGHTEPREELTDAEITLGGGADGIKAVWLRSHPVSEDRVAGTLALVRQQGEFAYVVAVGSRRGRKDARISLDRLGAELLLLVRDEGCKTREPGTECKSVLTVYLVRQGELIEGTEIVLEQVATGDGKTLGEPGELFHLTSSPSFVKDELKVVEHVSVKNRLGREIRWAELERVFVIMGDRFEPSDGPLWPRIVGPKHVRR